jgi:hypothetical protein
MMPTEIKLITKRTRHLIEAANYTLEYCNTVIEQSKKMIFSMNEKRFIGTKDVRWHTPMHDPLKEAAKGPQSASCRDC